MITSRFGLAAVSVLCFTGLVAFIAGRASATGAPSEAPLVYSGTLLDAAGKPVELPTTVKVALFDSLKGETDVPKCAAAPVTTTAGTGRFAIILPEACVQAVNGQNDLYAELTVGATTKTTLPRVKLGAVPYALQADVATKAAGAVGPLAESLSELAAAKAKVEELEGKVDGLAAAVATLEAAKPTASTHEYSWTKPAVVNTKGGRLLLVVSGYAVTGSSGILPTSVEVLVDSTKAFTMDVRNLGNYTAAMGGTMTLNDIGAGTHVIEFKPSSDYMNACVGCSLSVLELPK